MREEFTKIVRLTVSVITLTILIGIMIPTHAGAATITVPTDYGNIQDAINAANSGDTVYIGPGTYYEHLTITKLIILQGEDKSTTIIDGSGSGQVILISDIDYVTISDLTVKNGATGIYLPRSKYTTIKNVIASDNTVLGIDVSDKGSSHTTLQNIEAYSNVHGICAYSGSDYLKVIDSKLHDNSDCGVIIGWSSYWTIENTVSYSNNAGIGIDTSSDGTIRNCIIYNNNEGVGSGGIWPGEHGNTIVGNTIYSNVRGIRFDSSDWNNVVKENKIYDNDMGIYLYQWAQYPSYNNVFYHNDLSNDLNCVVEGNTVFHNTWDNNYPDGGNYYSDYTGSDTYIGASQTELSSDGLGDGIGDTVYEISTDNIDCYPLMKPWHSDFPYGNPPPATNQPPIADAGESYQANESSPVTFDASLSSDLDGDALQYRWDFESDGTWDTDWLDVPTATYKWADNWSGSATLNVSDGELTSTDTATVTINNVNPTVGEIESPIDPVPVNTKIETGCTFTDVGLEDTHSGIWDWGDGTSSPGSVSEANGAGTITGQHPYAEAGVYRVTLTVTDDDGGSSSVTTKDYVVIYNPEGGFITGGGWINSPAGAYVADDTLEGKATFGFVSKYEKGATVPTGKTEFQFKVADLNFKSISYDWLVVAGSKAKYKGTGTINGEGNYGFMLSAADGDSIDKFRIKIWDKDNGDITVYDNEIESDIEIEDDAEPSTAISGGSIVVHKEK